MPFHGPAVDSSQALKAVITAARHERRRTAPACSGSSENRRESFGQRHAVNRISPLTLCPASPPTKHIAVVGHKVKLPATEGDIEIMS